jgi:hypothetical protein
MWNMEPPRQIRGRQLLHIVRCFYHVRATKRDTFELKHLNEMLFWGDQHLPAWKLHWDDLVEHQRVPLAGEQLEDIFVDMCRQSDALRPHVEHYDRCDDEHPEHSYDFLNRMTMRVIKSRRGSKNLESLVAGNHAASKTKKTAALATTAGGSPDSDADTGAGSAKPKGGKEGKGGKQGKGGATPGDSTPTSASAGKGGKAWDPQRTCLENLFGKCKHGAALGKGVNCDYYGIHRKAPRTEDRERPFFKRLEKEHGVWEKGKFPYPGVSVAAPVVSVDDLTPPATPRENV